MGKKTWGAGEQAVPGLWSRDAQPSMQPPLKLALALCDAHFPLRRGGRHGLPPLWHAHQQISSRKTTRTATTGSFFLPVLPTAASSSWES